MGPSAPCPVAEMEMIGRVRGPKGFFSPAESGQHGCPFHAGCKRGPKSGCVVDGGGGGEDSFCLCLSLCVCAREAISIATTIITRLDDDVSPLTHPSAPRF
ncbi:unnamed protein product [Heligmosomoides polygyrus]|uniref:Uncharacterized protein n=1 Tax=Heligmosomoides polygyrus TaxID=6339 RepID=A0A183F2B4_HELPZ|nr:unnamed protein product [Heligmosomoides polygyrus]